MARPLRIEFPGAVYHITSRGNARQDIFTDDDDRTDFLERLSATVEHFHWICHAYCLMTNHYHLLIETPDGNLSAGMRQLNGTYTQAFNRKHRQVGHLFQGRFKSILVEKESHLLTLSRYIVRNPVAARMVTSAGHYAWSSYRATAGEIASPDFLSIDWLLSQFGDDPQTAGDQYARFVNGEEPEEKSPWESVTSGICLGSDPYVEGLSEHVKGRNDKAIFPKSQQYLGRPSLQSLLDSARNRKEREEAAFRASRLGYTQKEIGDFYGIHFSTVSRMVARVKGRR